MVDKHGKELQMMGAHETQLMKLAEAGTTVDILLVYEVQNPMHKTPRPIFGLSI